MKALLVCVFALTAAAFAQAPAGPGAAAPPAAPALPNLPDDTVIATFEDGVKLTMSDFRKIYAVLPPDNQQMALRDRRLFLQQWAFMRKLTQMAEAAKLHEASPTKEALAYYHMFVMSQAKINEMVSNTTVEPAEIIKFYDGNKENYRSVRVKAIYLSFNNNPGASPVGGKKPLTEEQAGAKAKQLLTSLRGGADFAKTAKDHSDDETSRAKDGDFATLRRSDNIPDALKAAIFALKQGELTEPVRQPNGFYIFRAEDVTVRPLSQVRDEIFAQLKEQRYGEWIEKANRDTKIEYNSAEFLGSAPAGK